MINVRYFSRGFRCHYTCRERCRRTNQCADRLSPNNILLQEKNIFIIQNTFHGLFEPVGKVAGAYLNDLFVQSFVLDWYDFESVSQVNLGDLQNSSGSVI